MTHDRSSSNISSKAIKNSLRNIIHRRSENVQRAKLIIDESNDIITSLENNKRNLGLSLRYAIIK